MLADKFARNSSRRNLVGFWDFLRCADTRGEKEREDTQYVYPAMWSRVFPVPGFIRRRKAFCYDVTSVNREEAKCTREVMKTTFSGYICDPRVSGTGIGRVLQFVQIIYMNAISYRAVPTPDPISFAVESAVEVKRIAKFGKGLPNRRHDRNFRSRRMQFVIRYRSDPSPYPDGGLFSLSHISSPRKSNNAVICAITLVSLPPQFFAKWKLWRRHVSNTI